MKSNLRAYFLVSLFTVALMLMMVLVAFGAGVVLAPYLTNSANAASESVTPVFAPLQALQTETTTTQNQPAAPLVQQPADGSLLEQYEQMLNAVYENSINSVVYIDVASEVSMDVPEHFGLPDEFFNRGQGSGFVWDSDGHIVTNHHVVEDATAVNVTFANGRTYEAEVVGTDPESDLAVLKIETTDIELIPLPRGNVRDLRVGQITIALGNPFGQEFTMTSGIVSAVGRTIRNNTSGFSIAEVIQTDAAINPGNSGGPLLSRTGEVIGINTMIMSRNGASSGVGFAVPINIANNVIPTLISGDDYEYAWLGIRGTSLTTEIIEALDLPTNLSGAVVIATVPDGPAEDAGLQGSEEVVETPLGNMPAGGDIITAIDGENVTGMDDLITYLVDKRPGDAITLSLYQADGETSELIVTLGARPDSVR